MRFFLNSNFLLVCAEFKETMKFKNDMKLNQTRLVRSEKKNHKVVTWNMVFEAHLQFELLFKVISSNNYL